MVKKRPRKAAAEIQRRALQSKLDTSYWRGRLFRNTFTYEGNTFQVSKWSVKIQHEGIRKTFSLRAKDRAGAAVEACRIYEAILLRGWESLPVRVKPQTPASTPAAS